MRRSYARRAYRALWIRVLRTLDTPSERGSALLTTRKHWRVLLAVLAAFALLVAACGGDDDDDDTSNTSGGTTDTTAEGTDFSALSGTINGSGATFPQAFYEAAIAGFAEEAPNATVNYGGGGSGKGKTDLADKVVDWAGTDSLVKPEDMSKYASGGGILYFPTVAAPITVSYNLSGVDTLKLDPETLGGIFARSITKWNDEKIAATNEGVDLPDTDIVVAHRSDGSGTTNNFTKYLTAAAPTSWTLGSGDTVNWAADTQAGNGNSGVAQIVSQTEGAIGYVDLADSDASSLSQAEIQNADGEFVAPTLDGATAALANAEVAADLTYDPLNAAGAGSYPITAPTYIIVYKTQAAATGDLVKGWIEYVLTSGQDLANDAGFASLPEDLQQKAIDQLDSVTVG
jgi:phosphate transport system substrate-binding protein